MATGDKLVTLDGLKAAYDKAKGFVAPDFAQATANAAGDHVIYNGSLYLLPEGHTANTTWADTTKQ